MKKIVIIEDEPRTRETYKHLLAQNFTELEVAGEAGNVSSAVALIREVNPDIVLMDIELEDGNSFQLLQHLRPYNFKIIFITAYNDYAIKAIKFSAFDYIMKPVNEFEFTHAVANAVQALNCCPSSESQVENLLDHYEGTQKSGKLVLRTSEALYVIKIDQISHCKSDNSYTTFFLSDKREILVSKGMTEYVEILEDYGFYRPHQSFLVNINQINKIDKSDGGFVVMENGAEIPISSRRKPSFLNILQGL
ncbi:LytR/AlgR family response regulator transcription factor [Geofilum rhodophaeum]|uniref:LytR/AlgR family response regulator transcription factor n=1 Tax=Geofilum rhodophaeum TaxID=1965019 RepID=UPI000B5209A5|nr:LytTR family DNA-binding domain-containing protein [Geofilum rhodophaeum]